MANNAAVSNFVSDITQDRMLPKLVDVVWSGNVISQEIMRDKARNWLSGHELVIPLLVTAPTTGGSYYGFDSFVTTQETKTTLAKFRPSQLYWSVPLSGIQLSLNSGDAKVLDLVANELNIAAEGLKQEIGTQFYSDGTGNSNKDILGLIAAVDDTTSVTTYGNVSRSTYTLWRGTRTAQSGSLALSDLAADFDAAQVGSDTPNLIVTTPAVWTLYEALLTPTVAANYGVREFKLTPEGRRPIDNLSANAGFRALAYRGVPVVADDKCPSGNIWTLNTNHFTWYNLPAPAEFGRTSNRGFQWTGWKEAINQDAVVGQLLLYGQLVCDSPRHNARRTGVTT